MSERDETSRMVPCRDCCGRGYTWPQYKGSKPVHCSTCDGTGYVAVLRPRSP